MIVWQFKLFLLVLMTTSGQSFNPDAVSAEIEKLLNNKTFMEMFNNVQLDTAPPLQDFPCTLIEVSGEITKTTDSTSSIPRADTSDVTNDMEDNQKDSTENKANSFEKVDRETKDSDELRLESEYTIEEMKEVEERKADKVERSNEINKKSIDRTEKTIKRKKDSYANEEKIDDVLKELEDKLAEIHRLEVLQDPYLAQEELVEINTVEVPKDRSLTQDEGGEKDTTEVLRDPNIAQSVHRLRPSDIKVIAALGDSITAGRAAGSRKLSSLLHDYRGLSWSSGGDESYNTFPSLTNILRKFNPSLYGFSTGVDSSDSRLNMAESGASNLPKQAMKLVEGMYNDSFIDIENDWKLITVLVGANDICHLCHDEISADDFVENLKTALDILHQLPRTLVNVVQVMSVDRLHELRRNPICSIVQGLVCDCVSFPVSESNFSQLIQARTEFQAKTEELLGSVDYELREDFAVVLQPFYSDTVPPALPNGDSDLSFFAVDCFHPSKKGQAVLGVNLWNNMLEPVNGKRTKIDWNKPYDLKCPSQGFPYFYTKLNSGHYLKQDGAQEVGVASPNDDYSIEILSIALSIFIGVAAFGFATYIHLKVKRGKGYQQF